MVDVLTLIDWTRLPASTRPIASMLVDGLTQRQIAARLDRSEDHVAQQVRLLRDSIVEQGIELIDKLSPALQAHVLSLRSSTASAGGEATGKRRTV